MNPARIHCEKLFLLLGGSFAPPAARSAAVRGFYETLSDSDLELVLRNEYGFSIFNYYELTGTEGFGSCYLQATSQVKTSLPGISLASKAQLQNSRLYNIWKLIARKCWLIIN